MLLRALRKPQPTPHSEECPPPMRQLRATGANAPTSAPALAVDIDELVTSPWIGMHYRYEFLLHHRHELLESDPIRRPGDPGSAARGGVAMHAVPSA
jgi:hypothetical protein